MSKNTEHNQKPCCTHRVRNEFKNNTFSSFHKPQQNCVSASSKIILLSPTESAMRNVKTGYNSIDMSDHKIQFYSQI